MRLILAFTSVAIAGWVICHSTKPIPPSENAADHLQIAISVLRQAGELASQQPEDQCFWTDRMLLRIGEVQMRAGDYEGARISIGSSHYKYGRDSGLIDLAQDLAGAGRRKESLEVLEELGTDHGWRQDFIDDGVRLRWIHYLVENGDLQQAREAVEELESKESRPEGLLKLAVASSNVEDAANAEHDFELAVAAALEAEDFHRVKALWTIAEAQVKLENADAARQTIRTLIDAADEVEPWAQIYALCEAGALLAELKDRDAAIEMFSRAVKSRQAVSASKRIDALLLIGSAEARVGYTDEALATVARIRRHESDLPQNADRERILIEIAKLQLRANDPIAAERTLMSSIAGVRDSDEALLALVRYQLEQRNFVQAMEAANVVQNSSRRASAVLMVATAYARMGRTRMAAEIASRIELNAKAFICVPKAGVKYDFRFPETWGSSYELGDAWTMAYMRWSDQRAAEVAKCSMELAQVLPLEPKPEYGKLLNDINSDEVIRALGRAYASTGNIQEALAWSQQIGSDERPLPDAQNEEVWSLERRINALVGVAEGILDRTHQDLLQP